MRQMAPSRRCRSVSEAEARGRPVVGPALLILTATAASGASGYLVTGIVAATVEVEEYTAFAVFWSALFLIVGGLGGVQHEMTRATSPRDSSAQRSATSARASVFAVAVACAVALALAVTAPLWASVLFGSLATFGVGALVVGAVGYVLVAVTCGLMYGIAAWRPLALMIGLDGLLRLAFVSAALAMDAPLEWLFVAVALPFVVTVAMVPPFVASALRRTVLDVGYRQLGSHTARTVIAATATATVVAGFPVLLRASDPAAPEAAIGPLILVLTLTRAPLVIPVMAMQSYLVVRFRSRPAALLRHCVVIAVAVIAAALALAALLAAVGPWLFTATFGSEYSLNGLVIAGLVASSGLVAALAVTGAALLSRSQHGAVTVGWLVAVLVVVLVLFALPLSLVDRALVALCLGPLLGLVVHGYALFRPNPRSLDL